MVTMEVIIRAISTAIKEALSSSMVLTITIESAQATTRMVTTTEEP